MQQGGLDWELIAMVAAAASLLVIVWDFFATRAQGRSEARKGLLEVAWPVLFIAVMGLLLKFTDFAAVLLLSAVITGIIWLWDARFARRCFARTNTSRHQMTPVTTMATNRINAKFPRIGCRFIASYSSLIFLPLEGWRGTLPAGSPPSPPASCASCRPFVSQAASSCG